MLSFAKGIVPAKGSDQSRKPVDVDKGRGAASSLPEKPASNPPGTDEAAQPIGTSGKEPGLAPVLIISSPADPAQPRLTAVASDQPAPSAGPARGDERASLRWLIPALAVFCLAATALLLLRRRSPRLQG